MKRGPEMTASFTLPGSPDVNMTAFYQHERHLELMILIMLYNFCSRYKIAEKSRRRGENLSEITSTTLVSTVWSQKYSFVRQKCCLVCKNLTLCCFCF